MQGMGICFVTRNGMKSLPKIGGRMLRYEDFYMVQSPSMTVRK